MKKNNMIEDDISEIDYNEMSLFTTPIGQIVQKEKTDIVLGRIKNDTDRSKYISNVNDCIYSISQSFWDIDLTIKLIKFADPKIKSFKMTRVDRGEYLKYHFENYFFRLPKLKDQVLNLLNVVFQLDYAQSNGLERKICSNPILQKKKLLIFIDYFNDAFSKIKPLRDIIAHRGDFSDFNLTMLTIYPSLKYDVKEYDSRLKGQIAYTYIFEENQGILKNAVIALLLLLHNELMEQLKIIGQN
ncbi:MULTISPECIES: Cthe_2314 family HEPN domain-containing protein [Elizabethkingia]|uniref:Cthe_2314 family HEPN domain-containing protein n=1 Tax=Elizabethkingia TaxID=308865 RepID=UPI0010C20F9E|nr:Cthe_2314 family HEPN domain-containing protein [Elizabethkingia sp. 2-6]QCO45929.1 hypothetical protein FCS00_05920 [Elizabethkingia sp. 2-6]